MVPLLTLGGVVVLVCLGLARGVWQSNLHNALLALAFAAVGAYLSHHRPGHREGALFSLTAAVHAVMFLGRQVGHAPGSAPAAHSALEEWWGWVGVWPVALSIALVTVTVLCFPDGRLPSPRWTPVLVAVVGVATACSLLSAVWPVEYASAGVTTVHPISSTAPAGVTRVWEVLAHPAYALMQLLWPVAIWARWRGADGVVRRQLAWLLLAAGVSAGTLLIGLAVWGSPLPGVLSAPLLPVAAGLAIVHGQHAAAYNALTWLSRSHRDADMGADLARAVSEALHAPATVWRVVGDDAEDGPAAWRAVGAWPPQHGTTPAAPLPEPPGGVVVRPVQRGDDVVGGISLDRAVPLTPAEDRLLDDLVSQAGLVLECLGLGELIEQEQRAGHLRDLTPREHEVLGLMARGLSNQAIGRELHLSVKTVEPVVGSIFAKLRLHSDSASNRRVLAVLAYLRD